MPAVVAAGAPVSHPVPQRCFAQSDIAAVKLASSLTIDNPKPNPGAASSRGLPGVKTCLVAVAKPATSAKALVFAFPNTRRTNSRYLGFGSARPLPGS